MTNAAAWLEVDLRAIAFNFAAIRSRLAPNVRIMAVVKADAYGLGAAQVAPVLVEAGADALAVATPDEGISLREAGLTGPIVVLGATLPEQWPEALAAALDLVISSPSALKTLSQTCHALGMKAGVHLKVDSGMGRLGMTPEEAYQALTQWPSNLNLAGVCTHYADASNPSLTRAQLDCFMGLIARLPEKPFCHSANSAALLDPATHLDGVRPGIALYGEAPWAKPVVSLRAKITQLRHLPQGTPLGYNHTYQTTQSTQIAVLPVGYADGLMRALSNRAEALIHGVRRPLVGIISMDQCLVDVGDLPVQTGDTVTLIGSSGSQQIHVRDWAELAHTIPYEILVRFGRRLPRIYLP